MIEAADKEDFHAEEANPQDKVEGDTDIEEITEAVGKMKVVGVNNKSLKDTFCLDLHHKVVTIDFLVLGMNKKRICSKVNNERTELLVGCVVPLFFAPEPHLDLADLNICHNTHKSTAYKDTQEALIANHGDGSEEEPLLGEPQKVQLPFIVEHEI